MFRRLTVQLTWLGVLTLVLLLGVGAALSGNLPRGLQDAAAEVGAAVGVDIPEAPEIVPESTVSGPDTSVPNGVAGRGIDMGANPDSLDVWGACVADAARRRALLRQYPEMRASGGGFDPVVACGPRPTGGVASPTVDRSGNRGGIDKPDAEPGTNDRGKPEAPGKADDAGQGAGVGKSKARP